MITYPTGMTRQARFIEGGVSFEIGILRKARMILAMTENEIRNFKRTWIDPEWNTDPKWARIQCQRQLNRGFQMNRVRDYARDLAAEH